MGLNQLEGIAAIGGCLHMIAWLKQSLHQTEQFDIILDYQYMGSTGFRRRCLVFCHIFCLRQIGNAGLRDMYLHLIPLVNLRGGKGFFVDRNVNGKGGALTFDAFAADLSAMKINKIARESQSQTGA